MRRPVGWSLLASGVVLALAALVLAPPATSLERWPPAADDVPHLISARGPAIARYDAETDTTVAVFPCGHGYCEYALRIEGDARARLSAPRIALATVERIRDIEPLSPPLELHEPYPPTPYVTQATFAARPFWPAFFALPVAFLLALAGAFSLWQGAQVAGRVAAGAVGGMALGTFTGTWPGDASVLGLVVVVFAAWGALMLTMFKSLKKGRWVSGAFALTALLMFFYARPWFPGMPSL